MEPSVGKSFLDRKDAGQKLAQKLSSYANDDSVEILALPRGGVIVAQEIANILKKPLDVFLVRKVGVPGHEELAMGAISSGGARHLNQSILEELKITPSELENAISLEEKELKRREDLYRSNLPPLDVKGKNILLVDDGLATGATALAAIKAIKEGNPKKIVVVVPVTAKDSLRKVETYADEVVFLEAPDNFRSVGQWYETFNQVSDEEVTEVLKERIQSV